MAPTSIMCRIILSLALVVHAGSSVHAQALDARAVFARTSPSTVLIQTADSSGTGIVLTDRGLILTNHHVVVGGVGLKVKLRMKFGTQIAVTELDQVEIVKVHPKYDLALLQAKAPPKASFIPATMIAKEQSVDTGSKCYVVGNPGGPDGNSLELSITEGLVSSASRKLEGMDFIQISAAMNPGNSGGPVCDAFGRVFGIVTWKMTQTEGIGFAIPSQKLAISEFVEQKDLPGDPAQAKQAEEIAFQLQDTAMRTTGDERLLYMVKAIEAYRFALQALPNDPASYHNIGIMYSRLLKPDIAISYFEAGLRVKPNFSTTLHSLGVSYAQRNGEELPKSIELWERALKDDEYPLGDSECAEDLAIKYFNESKYATVAYLLIWADKLNPRPNLNSQQKRQSMWTTVQAKLPPAEFTKISQYAGPFTYALYEAFRDGKPIVDMARVAATSTGAKTTEDLSRRTRSGLPPGSGTTSTPSQAPGIPSGPAAPALMPAPTPSQMKQFEEQAANLFGKSREPMDAGGKEIPLPARPSSFTLMNAGMRMAVWFPELLKVGVFNLASLKFDGFVDSRDANTLVASGGSVLALYLPGPQTLELYDSSTLQKRAQQQIPNGVSAPVRAIAMGLHQPMQVYVLFKRDQGAPQLSPGFIRLPGFNLQPMEVKQRREGYRPFTNLDGPVSFSMDESGTYGSATRPNTSPTGLATYQVGSDGSMLYDYKHSDAREPRPTRDGKMIFTNNGIFNVDAGDDATQNRSGDVAEMLALSTVVVGYDASVSLYRTLGRTDSFIGFRVSSLANNSTINEVKIDSKMFDKIRGSGMQRNGVLIATAPADRIVCGNLDEKRLFVFPLGLGFGTLGGPATPGKPFEKKLILPEGATATLENGPAGLTFDPATLTVRWQVPATQARGQAVQVLLLVKKADGSQDYQVEKIPVP